MCSAKLIPAQTDRFNRKRDECETTAAAYWHKAEVPLLDPIDMKADVLTILDCCYASDAHKGFQGGRRIYDLLAACPPGKPTPAPGARSFSRRLIDTLNRLLDEDESQRILTTRLMKEINQINPGFHHPVMLYDRLHRGMTDGRHVQLVQIDKDSKLKTEEDVKVSDNKPHERASVVLRFSLHDPRMTQTKIESWAHRLIRACNGDEDVDVALRRIDWVEMQKTEPGDRFRNLVDIMAVQAGPRDHFRRIVRAVVANNRLSKKRSLPELDPSLPPAKRRSSSGLSNGTTRSTSEPLTPESNKDS